MGQSLRHWGKAAAGYPIPGLAPCTHRLASKNQARHGSRTQALTDTIPSLGSYLFDSYAAFFR